MSIVSTASWPTFVPQELAGCFRCQDLDTTWKVCQSICVACAERMKVLIKKQAGPTLASKDSSKGRRKAASVKETIGQASEAKKRRQSNSKGDSDFKE